VDIKGVSARRTLRPPRCGQLRPRHHRVETINEGRDDPGFDRWQGDPAIPTSHHPIGVNHRPRRRHHERTPSERPESDLNVPIVGRQTHPVLKGVEAHRGRDRSRNEEKPRPTCNRQPRPAMFTRGPVDDFNGWCLTGSGPRWEKTRGPGGHGNVLCFAVYPLRGKGPQFHAGTVRSRCFEGVSRQ
jgi:hypothetical protein